MPCIPLIFHENKVTTNFKENFSRPSDLKLLKNEEIIDKASYKNIKPVGSRPGILYRLAKMQKVTKNGLPPCTTFVSYWYDSLQTSKIFTTIFHIFN